MAHSRISYLWNDAQAPKKYSTGVSLHSHTNQSKETLDFIANLAANYKMVRPFLAQREQRARENHGIILNFATSYWTPPLTPKLAFDLERGQVENTLGLRALVSISDHDNITAPMLLRTVASARHIPVSVEWSVPVEGVCVHLGIHNLPSGSGTKLMKQMERITAMGIEGGAQVGGASRKDDAEQQAAQQTKISKAVTGMLETLHSLPNVLIIFNHPVWDLYQVGQQKHMRMVDRFLQRNKSFIHAIELNGLRGWPENRAAIRLAQKWEKILISGGDRHGVEPNANLNLTNAESFTEFVSEIRDERRSHLLFMPQYAQPWKHRVLRSTLDAIRNYPDFPIGSRRWDERVFHADKNGVVKPVSELWPNGNPPRSMQLILGVVKLLGSAPLSNGLRIAWDESHELQTALGETERA